MNEQTPKRSWFAPIVLSMLVFSLMGNVFLYSKQLQNEQRARIQSGERIIQSAWDSKLHIEGVTEGVLRLIDSSSAAERIEVKQDLGYAFKTSRGLSEFIEAALAAEQRELAEQRRTADSFIADIELSLRNVANHDGPLSEQEGSYLVRVWDTYAELLQQIHQFNVRTSQQNALQTERGGAWIALAYDMLSAINEPETVLYEGVKMDNAN